MWGAAVCSDMDAAAAMVEQDEGWLMGACAACAAKPGSEAGAAAVRPSVGRACCGGVGTTTAAACLGCAAADCEACTCM